MPKKKRANGYSATKTRKTPSSIGRDAGLGDVEERADEPGDDREEQRASRRSGCARCRPSISRPKYQKMASVMTVQRSGSLASGHVHEPPHLAAADRRPGRARGSASAAGLMAHTNIDSHAHESETSTVVETSSVPSRNHVTELWWLSGVENEKRPAIGRHRILGG